MVRASMRGVVMALRYYYRPAALLLLPGRLGFPFILLAENPRMSPLLMASPLLVNLFLPPKPNF